MVMSVLANIVFITLVSPVLLFAEKHLACYSDLLIERKNGEIKNSLVIVFGMYALIIGICWGWLGEKWLILACVYAWGVGDAAAALIGKKYGKHCLEGGYIEGCKSVEGTLAMFAVSFLSVIIILLANGKVAWYGYAPIAALTAAVCAAVELYTPNGMDTLPCPIAAAAVILPLVHLWGI
jgi:phytol kinase